MVVCALHFFTGMRVSVAGQDFSFPAVSAIREELAE